MTMKYQRRHGSKLPHKKTTFQSSCLMRLTALFLCLSVLAGVLPVWTILAAADGRQTLFGNVDIQSITLHYAGTGKQPIGHEVPDQALIKKDDQLVLQYRFDITEQQCGEIEPGIPYYLEVSPHLVPASLVSGAAITVKTEDGGEEPFGKICADGQDAWVTFDAGQNGGTILSELAEELKDAFFYLHCSRAGQPPEGEQPIEGSSNLYAMKFETGDSLAFGYAENEPVKATAKIEKKGARDGQDQTITWTIQYTPWQNPSGGGQVTLDTPFELRDTIDSGLHSYVKGSVKIAGTPVPDYDSRDKLPEGADTYVVTETISGGGIALSIGGTKLNAGKATQGTQVNPLTITYQTAISDELLLKGGSGGQKVTNAVELFAGKGGGFDSTGIKAENYVTVKPPEWLTKEGFTERSPDGNGSVTSWKVVFHPNGFAFHENNSLTLHDRLPDGSTLVEGSVKVGDTQRDTEAGENNEFTVSGLTTTGSQEVIITYQTRVPEEMYDSGTDLGNNAAWFTFTYNSGEYSTPEVTTPVSSGNGSGSSGTNLLVKESGTYNASDRTIDWKVTINPWKVDLRQGTFTDDMSAIGPAACGKDGHKRGLEVIEDSIKVSVSGEIQTGSSLALKLDDAGQKITLTALNGRIGRKTITMTYKTKVCDPCIFANNTAKVSYRNTVLTEDMVIGNHPAVRSASASGTAVVSASVLTKEAPVYDYAKGTMKWTVQVDKSELSMADVVLTDDLPEGQTFIEGSFLTAPEIEGASAGEEEGRLEIHLGSVKEKTTVTFETKVDPEAAGFNSNDKVVVKNTIHMSGKADGIGFEKVSHSVEKEFSNHGLVKKSSADAKEELIQYEVLINPYRLALPKEPALVDTMDPRLQLDMDTLRFYKVNLDGMTSQDELPRYRKQDDGQKLDITDFDPETNSFTVKLPIERDSRDAYLLTYTADIIQWKPGSYQNSVRFDGGTVMLGGVKDNSENVGGGGGGGGGGVAARKAVLAITKTDQETHAPLSGVSFMLYQWDADKNTRGLPFAKGETGADGKLSFKVKPEAFYELVETKSIPGYSSVFGAADLPDDAVKTEAGLLVRAGAAKTELTLELTNEAHTADIEFRMVNESGIPMAGEKVQLFKTKPDSAADPAPDMEIVVSADGTVKFPGIRRGAAYYIQCPGGGVMTIEVPAQASELPKVKLPDGTEAVVTADYRVTGKTGQDQQWTLTVSKVISGSTAPLAGAEIGLYADAACQALIKNGVSKQDGSIAFPGLIKGQSYWLKEIAAPENYNLDSAVYKADAANPVVIIENTPKEPPVNPDDSGTPEEPSIPEEPVTPAEPAVPGGPATPGESVVPGEPTVPGEPFMPGESIVPGEPSVPEDPTMPGEASVPEDSDKPEELAVPEDPTMPGEASVPEDSDKPEELAVPGEPTVPEESDVPKDPAAPEDPAVPGTSGGLHGTSAPAVPGKTGTDISVPEKSHTSDAFGGGSGTSVKRGATMESGISGSGDTANFAGSSNPPQTGDYTLLLFAVTLFSGILSAVMTLCRLLRAKKHEKK